MPPNEIDFTSMLIGLVGGLALFLFGMDLLSRALRATAGRRLREHLARATSNRIKGVMSGAAVTAALQSSSLTMVLQVGFLSAGLITLEQAIPLTLGAEIGTTLTAQLIAFPVGEYALAGVAVGFALRTFGRQARWRNLGGALLGLGMVFFAMGIMSQAMRPLRTYEPFLQLLGEARSPLLGILLGALFTAMIQSSSAMTAIVIALASQGVLQLDAGIAIVLGANVGTCVTGWMASIGRPTEARRLVLVQLVYNLICVALAVPLLDLLSEFVRAVSPAYAGLSGTERLAAEAPRQIANAHTIFNLAGLLVFLPFTLSLAALARRLVRDRPSELPRLSRPAHLDPALCHTPSGALEAARRELVRMGQGVLAMYANAPEIVAHGSELALDDLAIQDDEVDGLHEAILRFLGETSQAPMTETESRDLHAWMAIANHLEAIADTIETNLVARGRERLATGVEIPRGSTRALEDLYELVRRTLEDALAAVDGMDASAAERVVSARDAIEEEMQAAERELARRLLAPETRRMESYQIESDIVEHVRHIYDFARRIAEAVQAVLPAQE